MTELRIGEASTVQFPMVAHAVGTGWTPLSPASARARRGDESEMLLRDELENALHRFNQWLSADGVRQVVERLQAIPPTIEGNREMLSWLRGERQWYDEAERRHRPIQVIDFMDPNENVLHVTWEWTIKPPGRKGNRADVMFLINGVPVCIVEHKNPNDRRAIERAVVQLKRYEKETPELIGGPQLFNVTHLLDYWYGVTWNANRRFMARWKEQPEETYRFAVQAFFEPTDFLRTLQHWILFYVEDGETRKSVLRQHQRIAIDKVLARCEDPSKRRGLVWHTQGSGKTFTLLTAARLILEDKERFANATVIVVVDRTELEGQLKGWVEKLLGEMQQQDISVWRASSKDQLEELLRTDKRGLVISMIHKFEGLERDVLVRDNVYVFIDEAHRSVAKDLGSYLMAALPRATIIGFTGTPIAKTADGEGTFKIFGAEDNDGYLDRYRIRESIEDETTLPLRHTMAPSEMTLPSEHLDEEFWALAKDEGITDIDELNKVLQRAVKTRTFLSADEHIDKVAGFVAEHFKENVLPLGYKAFLVAVSREACAKYKRALDKLLPQEWTQAVYTESAADIVERPLVAELQLSEQREADIRILFKKSAEDPKILIVTDKLLTGYDAEILYCMYLDKPMRDHVLLQAIARVNRPHTDPSGTRKHIGLVIDFVGVLRDLKKALKFDSADVSGVIEDLDLLLVEFREKIQRAQTKYLETEPKGTPDERLESLVYGRFLGPEPRRVFFDEYKEIEVLWEILSPSAELRDYITTFKNLAQLYMTVRNAYSPGGGFVGDLATKTSTLVQDNVTQEAFGRIVKTVTFDVDTLDNLRKDDGTDEGKVFNLVRGLRSEIEADPDLARSLQSLKDRAERILKDLEDRTTTGLAALNLLEALAREKREAIEAAEKSGVSPRAFAVYWNFKEDPALKDAGISAANLAVEVDGLLSRFPNAEVNTDESRMLRASLYRPLLELESQERGRVVDAILAIVLGGESSASL